VIRYDLVIPTTRRRSLTSLLEALAAGEGPWPDQMLLVDDRPDPAGPLPAAQRARVVRGPRRGPAAARNAGWRAGSAPWVAFLDDDVLPRPGWRAALAADLAAATPGTGAVQGRIAVPLPSQRRPTDWERNVAGLQTARWATADMAYRRAALAAVGGFDERFPRAYREDADLGLRVTAAGWTIARGDRVVSHPIGPAPAHVSLTKQAGNADDVLMGALHGRGWRRRAGVPAGRRPRHLLVAGAGLAAAVTRSRPLAVAWAAGTAELAWARIAPGPRTPRELGAMAWTSAVMPFAAAGWWLWGLASLATHLRDVPRRPAAVLFDRDGTLVEDVPYNGDPARVAPMPSARAALDKLRAAGVPTAVVSNQSGVARGVLAAADVEAVNRRIEELLGPLGPWAWCPHGPADGCGCRKPAPGLVLRAAAVLGVSPRRCAVIGDIGADVDVARAAGARAVLVPTARTRREEVAAAPEVARDLEDAVDRLLAGS
jgi:histidinol-phosphate phosphatase family protein